MAKQGQHKHDKHDHRLMPQTGHTNPRKSTEITTGPVKTRKRRAKQVVAHQDLERQAQKAPAHWDPDTTHYVTHEADSRVRMRDRKTRSGSDSNTDKGTRGY
jgi:hypothetical protein